MQEDVWEVEVSASATVAELKEKIEELYEVPRQTQRLARSAEPSAPLLEDDVRVESLGQQSVHLLPPALSEMGLPGLGMPLPVPSPEQQAAFSEMMSGLLGAATENAEVRTALEESLKGVSYTVHFQRPTSAGGKAAGKKVTLTLDALAMVGTVQEMVEVELFGETGAEPAFLVFEGRSLHPRSTLHRAGIDDGKVVLVLADQPPRSEQEQLLAGLLGAAPGGLVPGLLPPAQLQQMLAGISGLGLAVPGSAPAGRSPV